MEIKNIHNNPEERGFFGKVWRYIIGGLRSLTRPKKNTKWDYIVPLSLVGLVVLPYNYSMMHYEIYDPTKDVYDMVEKSLWEIRDVLFAELIFGLLVILTTIFSTRVQRLLVLPGSLSIFLIAGYFYNPKISIFNTVMATLFLVFILAIPYFLSALSLLIKFGNNSKERISKKPTPIRSAVAWGVYGFGLDFVFLSLMPLALLGGQAGILYHFLFEEIYDFWLIFPGYSGLLFFPILFALIGYIIEKYKGGKTR